MLSEEEPTGLTLVEAPTHPNMFAIQGMNRLRAIILYELQAVVSVRSRKLVISRDINKDELQAHVKVRKRTCIIFSSEEVISYFYSMQVVKKMLQEAATIFAWEAPETDEGRLAAIASKELKDIDIFLKSLELMKY